MLFYLIGIKGSAMSALANILVREGYKVSGADVVDYFYTCHDLTVPIDSFDHIPFNQDYFYIIGNAFTHHPITLKIIENNLSYDYYPTFLVHHFQNKKWICVAGTHGKTTTSKMISTILPNATALIGDGSFHVDDSPYFILESCEYRNTFLNYHPYIGLVLNVDYDHVDFFKTREEYEQSFQKFIEQSKIAIVNGDSCSIRDDYIITYGLQKDNDVVFEYKDGMVKILNKPFYLPIKGLSYAYDFVGAYLVGKLLNILDCKIQKRISNFEMPKRRFETVKTQNQVIVLDYAHHPNEIKAIHEAMLETYPNHKIITVFEPHTITRLDCFIDDFKNALSLFDECYLHDLFTSVREEHQLSKEEELYHQLGFLRYDKTVLEHLLKEKNVVIAFLGAGRIDETYHEYLKHFFS